MTEAHGDSVVIYRSAVIHGFCTAEIVIFSRFPPLWNLAFKGSPEHTGINILFLCRVPAGQPLFII